MVAKPKRKSTTTRKKKAKKADPSPVYSGVENMDPLKLIETLWPKVRVFKQQAELIHSVFQNDETIVIAGNMLGKDFSAALVILVFFLTRTPCRIITTSAKDDHLRVLWGEIHKFIQESVIPLDYKQGGPLIINQRELKRFYNGTECKISYVKGMVASPDSMAAMQGHHVAKTGDGIPRTLFVADECSSVPDEYLTMARTWANRILGIGNPWPCDNFFYKADKGDDATGDPGGDMPREHRAGYHRKVIKIKAQDSPNVIYGLKEVAAGKKPSFKMVIPGVKDYEEYMINRKRWDEIQQCVCLDAEFYEGDEVKLCPEAWLKLAHEIDDILSLRNVTRRATCMGVDGGEGRSATVWTIVDEYGIVDMYSEKTYDTSVIIPKTIGYGQLHNIPPEKWVFDRGGGGKQYVDLLKKKKFKCSTVAFGEAATNANRFKRGMKTTEDKTEDNEVRTVYKNRRAEMYGMLREALNPNNQERTEAGEYVSGGFAIPRRCAELVRQLKPLPLLFDSEGEMYLPPKDKRDPTSKIKTITELVGKSPDEADSVVLALYGSKTKFRRPRIGGY